MYGKGLRKQLDRKEMTAYRLSLESGVNKAVLSRILSGKSKYPTTQTLEKICKVLGCWGAGLRTYERPKSQIRKFDQRRGFYQTRLNSSKNDPDP